MASLSYSDIQTFLNNADLSRLPGLSVTILRNIVVEPVEPYLRYLAYDIGYNAKVRYGGYDNVLQDAVIGQDAGLWDNPDYVLVFLKLDTLSRNLSRSYVTLSPDQVEAELSRIKEHVAAVIDGIRGKTDATILWHGFEIPAYPALGILDSQSSDGQIGAVNALNESVRNSLKSVSNAYFVDLNLCLMRLGYDRFYDSRYWHVARAPFARQALSEIAIEDFKYIRALKGRAKKCLVLDCDGVLWGGVIGEDGLTGIQLGQTHPGSAFYEFQQEVVNLYNRGIIIALCSKNNEDDVWEVFEKHPDMILKKEHVVAYQINWRDKVTNLEQIARDLNIGLDSMVFVDDSEFEVNLVRKTLPVVDVIHVPPDKATGSRDILVSCGYFESATLSAEDKNRGAMYKAEVARKDLQGRTQGLEGYLKALEMVLELRFADEFSFPRIAQLTQKTNQFNLTTRRYSDADIEGFASGVASDVIYVRLKDRFGDSGIVGVCILKYENDRCTIDTFLLSCRVIGRGVEDAFLAQALKLARERGMTVVVGEYCATAKNGQVAQFYSKRGFESLNRKEEAKANRHIFVCALNGQPKPVPSFFGQVVSEIGGQQEM